MRLNKLQTKITWAGAIGLWAVSLLGMMLVGERVFAAFFNLWKFGGYPDWQGIDVGAYSSFICLMLCLCGLAGSFGLFIICKPQAGTLLSRVLIGSAVIYLIDATLLSLIVASGLAYLYCGR